MENTETNANGKKPKIVKAVRAAAFLAVLALCLLGIHRVLIKKDGPKKVVPFYRESANMDVLFLGTSHVADGVYPMELWNKYGIPSYNLAVSQSTMATNYWILRQALEHTTPKVVVVDLSRVRMSTKSSFNLPMVQIAFDGYPTTPTKIRAVYDTLKDGMMGKAVREERMDPVDFEDRKDLSLLVPMIMYHTRWKELTLDDFRTDYNTQKGASYMTAVATPKEFAQVREGLAFKTTTTGGKYLRKIVDLCKERGIEVVMTYLPFPASMIQQREANTGYLFEEKLGVDYLDFLDMDVVNYDTDCYDPVSHLNQSGARKVTDYLGRYLIEHYGLTDHRGEPEYSHWDDDYAKYEEFKNETLTTNENIFEYLMLLYDSGYDICIEAGRSDFLRYKKVVNQLANLGVDTDLLTDETDYILISGKGTAVIDGISGKQTAVDTEAGRLRVKTISGGKARYFEGNLFSREPDLDETKRIMRVNVLRRETGEVVDCATFHYNAKTQKSYGTVRPQLEVEEETEPDAGAGAEKSAEETAKETAKETAGAGAAQGTESAAEKKTAQGTETAGKPDTESGGSAGAETAAAGTGSAVSAAEAVIPAVIPEIPDIGPSMSDVESVVSHAESAVSDVESAVPDVESAVSGVESAVSGAESVIVSVEDIASVPEEAVSGKTGPGKTESEKPVSENTTSAQPDAAGGGIRR